MVPLLQRIEYQHISARRRLLKSLSRVFGLLILVAIGIPVLSFLMPPHHSMNQPNLLRIATVGELGEDTAKPGRIGDKPIVLVRRHGDDYYALSASCTLTSNCRLDWIPDEHVLACPCHHGTFDLRGNVVTGPAPSPLASFEVDILGDAIYIRREY